MERTEGSPSSSSSQGSCHQGGFFRLSVCLFLAFLCLPQGPELELKC